MWDLKTEMLDSDILSGLVPVLFSDSPAVSEAALKADQATARKDIEALNRAYFIPENVDLEEALKIVRKPRLGCEYAFKSQNLERLFHPTQHFASLTGTKSNKICNPLCKLAKSF